MSIGRLHRRAWVSPAQARRFFTHMGGALNARSVVLVALWLAACQAAGATLNVVEAAGLREAVSIEIVEVPEPGAQARPAVTVSDPDAVAAIVAALDADLPLVPSALCRERYRLRFTLRDGSAQEFGYSCDGGPAFMRGSQAFWGSRDVEPPQAFQNLMADQIREAQPAAPD